MIHLITKGLLQFNLPEYMRIATMEECLEYFKGEELIGVDTETTGFDPYIADIYTLQLGNQDDQFVIDCETVSIQGFKPLLEDKSKTFLFQNAKFDLRFLYRHKILCPNIYDTYLAEATLTKGDNFSKKSLDYLATKYGVKKLDKSIRGKIIKEGLSKRVVKYAAEDVEVLIPIKERQEEALRKYNLVNSIKLENSFVRVLAYVEYCGIYLDATRWHKKVEEDKHNLEEAKAAIDAWVIENAPKKYTEAQLDLFNSDSKCNILWSSPMQVAQLFKDLGIDVGTIDEKTGEVKDSVDARVLGLQKDKFEIIPMYIHYKECEKTISTYGDNVLKHIHKKTGRIHTSFKQIVRTGRMSSGSKKEGTLNLQNIPADDRTRACFVPQKDDYVFVDADFSGQEQIVFANFTKDKNLLQFYKDKLGDMHSFIASKLTSIYPQLTGLSLAEIKEKFPLERGEAKKAGFALNYGGNGRTVAENVGVSEESGDKIYEDYFRAFPGIKDYAEKTQRKALKYGYIQFNDVTYSKAFLPNFDEFKDLEKQVYSPGFWEVYREEKRRESALFISKLKPLVRKYFKYKGEVYRKSLNAPIQGTAAEITKLAAIYVFDWLIQSDLIFKVLITNLIHDELLLESPRECAEKVAAVVTEKMRVAGSYFCKTIPLTADSLITQWWKH